MEAAQVQNNSVELNRGHKEFDAKVKDIEGIFKKLDGVLDLSNYKKDFYIVLKDAQKDKSFNNDMIYAGLQMDYEEMIYDKYNARLDAIYKSLEDEVLPFYELYLLASTIQDALIKISDKNIGEIIKNTKSLIEKLNNLNTHNKKEKNYIIELAYRTIYSVLLHEEIFDRSDILDYVRESKIKVNIENLGRLLEQDLKLLDKKELRDLDLMNIETEGLGYDYLDRSVISKISESRVGKVKTEFQEARKKAFEDVEDKERRLTEFINEEQASLARSKDSVKSNKFRKKKLMAELMSLALIPAVTITIGHRLGREESDKVLEYKTITRTVDAVTGEVVGDVVESYDEKETTYVATVLEKGPWKENRTGGYVRNVVAYDYKTPDGSLNGFHVDADDLQGNLIEKYRYMEAKDTLDETDSVTETTILITETYQDKNATQKSEKFVIPFTLCGIVLGATVDLIIFSLRFSSLDRVKSILSNLDEEIRRDKLSEEQVSDKINSLKKELLEAQQEKEAVIARYGKLGETFAFEDFYKEDKGFSRKLK